MGAVFSGLGEFVVVVVVVQLVLVAGLLGFGFRQLTRGGPRKLSSSGNGVGNGESQAASGAPAPAAEMEPAVWCCCCGRCSRRRSSSSVELALASLRRGNGGGGGLGESPPPPVHRLMSSKHERRKLKRLARQAWEGGACLHEQREQRHTNNVRTESSSSCSARPSAARRRCFCCSTTAAATATSCSSSLLANATRSIGGDDDSVRHSVGIGDALATRVLTQTSKRHQLVAGISTVANSPQDHHSEISASSQSSITCEINKNNKNNINSQNIARGKTQFIDTKCLQQQHCDCNNFSLTDNKQQECAQAEGLLHKRRAANCTSTRAKSKRLTSAPPSQPDQRLCHCSKPYINEFGASDDYDRLTERQQRRIRIFSDKSERILRDKRADLLANRDIILLDLLEDYPNEIISERRDKLEGTRTRIIKTTTTKTTTTIISTANNNRTNNQQLEPGTEEEEPKLNNKVEPKSLKEPKAGLEVKKPPGQNDDDDRMTVLMNSHPQVLSMLATTSATVASAATTVAPGPSNIKGHSLTRSQMNRQLKRQAKLGLQESGEPPVKPPATHITKHQPQRPTIKPMNINHTKSNSTHGPKPNMNNDKNYSQKSGNNNSNPSSKIKTFYQSQQGGNLLLSNFGKQAGGQSSDNSSCGINQKKRERHQLARSKLSPATPTVQHISPAYTSTKAYNSQQQQQIHKLHNNNSFPLLAHHQNNPSKRQQQQITDKHEQHYQQQQHQQYQRSPTTTTTRFPFDRNHIKTREHRSLSTSSSMTTESSEGGASVASSTNSGSSNSSVITCSPASSGYSSPNISLGGSVQLMVATATAQHDSKQKKFKRHSVTASSSLESSNGDSSSVSDYLRQPPGALHPTVSALLLSTANLSLNKSPIGSLPPQPPPTKRSKKIHTQQQPPSPSSLSSSSSSSSSWGSRLSSESPSSSPDYITRNSYTQDATYFARSSLVPLGGLSPPPAHAAALVPPRPWLKPDEQLNYLSRSRLKQMARTFQQQHHVETELRLQKPLPPPGSVGSTILPPSQTMTTTTATNLRQQQPQEFTVLSYNVLSDRMVNTERFPSSPDLALNWLYRRELILRQLLEHKADVIALQELEWEQYETYFKPKLEELGGSGSDSTSSSQFGSYCGLFEPKSRARTMDLQMRKRVDGCAIFYKRHKFKLVARHLLEFNQIAMANARGSEAMLNRVMTKDNIGLAAVLELRRNEGDGGNDLQVDDELKNEQQQEHQQRLVVCNTHIHWNPDCCDVKLVQTIMLMNELKHIARHYCPVASRESQPNLLGHQHALGQPAELLDDLNNKDITQQLLPLILLGDFNSLPKSGVIDFLLKANIDSSHKDFMDIKYTQCSNALALRDSNLAGAATGCATSQPGSGGPAASPTTTSVASPNLIRRASQQPHSVTAATSGDRLDAPTCISPLTPHRRLVELEDKFLARRSSSPITTSTPPPTTTLLNQCLDSPGKTPGQEPKEGLKGDKKQDLEAESEIILYEHPFSLASAYERGVMPFTSYTTKFKATIDYIFFDQQQVELLGLLGPLDKLWLKANRIKGFPQLQFPSDHLPLLARLRLKPSSISTNGTDQLESSSPAVGLSGKRDHCRQQASLALKQLQLKCQQQTQGQSDSTLEAAKINQINWRLRADSPVLLKDRQVVARS